MFIVSLQLAPYFETSELFHQCQYSSLSLTHTHLLSIFVCVLVISFDVYLVYEIMNLNIILDEDDIWLMIHTCKEMVRCSWKGWYFLFISEFWSKEEWEIQIRWFHLSLHIFAVSSVGCLWIHKKRVLKKFVYAWIFKFELTFDGLHNWFYPYICTHTRTCASILSY